jgi:hypothetical protein
MAHQNYQRTAPPAACPAPMTRAALLVLRNAGSLLKDCDYVITDHVQGRLVAGTQIHLQAVSAGALSEAVSVNTTYDNEAWAGVYDLDRGLVLELTDNRGNVAKGINGNEVGAFDWGNPAYTNVLVDSSSLIVTYGNPAVITNVEIKSGSTVTLTGFTGSLNHFEVEIVASVNLTGANGVWRYGKVIENSTFNASGYQGGGDSYYFEVSDASNIQITNTLSQINFRTSDFHAMTLSCAGLAVGTGTLTFLGCDMWQGSVVKASLSGVTTVTRLNITGQAQLVHNSAAALNVSNTTLGSNANINIAAGSAGTVNISQSEATGSSTIVHNGLGSFTVTRCDVRQGSSIITDAGSNVTCSFTNDSVDSGSSLRVVGASTAGTFTVNDSDLTGGSFIYKRHTGNLTCAQCSLFASSGIDAQSGDRSYNVSRSSFTELSRAVLTGTGGIAVTDNIVDVNASTRGSINISCSGTANSISSSTVSGVSGSLTLGGTTGGQVVGRCKLYDGSLNIQNCTVNLGALLLTASDAGVINCSGVTAAKSLQYLSVRSQGAITVNNSTGGGTLTQIDVGAGGSYVCSGTAAGAARVDISGGPVSHNGGVLNHCFKRLLGTLTTGAFNHTNIAHIDNASVTLTAVNTNRSRYQGLLASAYTATGNLI